VSNPVRPDLQAFQELQFLIYQVGEELASFRKRAHAAEQRLKAIATGAPAGAPLAAEERVAQLEAENARLNERLAAAEAQTARMLDQVRFLRQQHVLEGEP
jgi:predicted  nucleic acid-binding Zn-ribbon protein